MHQAEIGENRAGQCKSRRVDELSLDDEDADRAEHESGQDRTAAHDFEAMVQHADISELLEADLRCRSSGGGERSVDQRLRPSREVRRQCEDDCRSVLRRRRLEGLRADQHADVEKDRRDCDDRDDGEEKRDDSEPAQNQHHDARRGGIPYAAAHRLPAGMADVDGVDEGVAEEATDEAHHAIGRQYSRRREMVACGLRALDVVHGLHEIVDAEGNGRDEDNAEILEPGENVIDGRDRNREAEIGECRCELCEAHAADVETEGGRDPGHDDAKCHRDEFLRGCRADSARPRTSSRE